MELRHLRYFTALAHAGSFTKAADIVHVTQSTLSHQISQLEIELGKALFVREPRGVRLTLDGQLFLNQAERALEAIEAGIRQLRDVPATKKNRVRIAATPTLANQFVSSALFSFLASERDVLITIQEKLAGDMHAALMSDEVDLAVAYPPMNTLDLQSEFLFSDEMFVIVCKDHPLAKRRRVRLVDLHGVDVVFPTHNQTIRELIDGFFQIANSQPTIVAEVDNIGATMNLVSALRFAGLLPSSVPTPKDLISIPIERPFVSREVTLYWRKDKLISSGTSRVSEAIRAAGHAFQRIDRLTL
jgi:LysR family cyn operon transcriptional activator